MYGLSATDQFSSVSIVQLHGKASRRMAVWTDDDWFDTGCSTWVIAADACASEAAFA